MLVSGHGQRWPELDPPPNPDLFALHSPDEIKAWRIAEDRAGRPSGVDDFLRAHQICAACRHVGYRITGWEVDADEDDTNEENRVPHYSRCETCGGTGRMNPIDIGGGR